MGDRALVYRGADQPDMSVINPEADVWQHIKVLTSLIGEGKWFIISFQDPATLPRRKLAYPIFVT